MIALDVDVPFANFRRPHAWAYFETYPLPPPATVYGFLLSFVGLGLREDGASGPPEPHAGVRLGLARLGAEPAAGLLLRKHAQRKYEKGNARVRGSTVVPEEVLCDVRLRIWLDSAQEAGAEGEPTLEARVDRALDDPASVPFRAGGLSLGESRDLVNRVARASVPAPSGAVLVPSASGTLVMPIWSGHRDRAAGRPRWRSFELREVDEVPVLAEPAWLTEPLLPEPEAEEPTLRAARRRRSKASG